MTEASTSAMVPHDTSGAQARRACPLCDHKDAVVVFPLKAREFARQNWTYVTNFASLLGIDEEAEFPVVRCRSCDFVYVRHLPSACFLDMVYDKVIDSGLAAKASRDPHITAARMNYVSRLARLRPPRDGAAALDYGCGFGVTSRLLAILGYRVVAFDPSRIRRDFVTEAGSTVDVVATLDVLNRKAPYAVIVLDNVLEHTPDPIAVVRMLGDMSDAGTVVYVSVPSYEPKRVAKLAAEYSGGRLNDMTLNPWEHLNYFSLRHLDRTLEQGGFAPVRACELASAVDIGVRAENQLLARLTNAASSAVRLARYVATGRAVESTEKRFYARVGP